MREDGWVGMIHPETGGVTVASIDALRDVHQKNGWQLASADCDRETLETLADAFGVSYEEETTDEALRALVIVDAEIGDPTGESFSADDDTNAVENPLDDNDPDAEDDLDDEPQEN